MGNSHVNHKGKVHGGGSPKATDMGKDLSKNATNSMDKYSNRELSPSATSNSRNQK